MSCFCSLLSQRRLLLRAGSAITFHQLFLPRTELESNQLDPCVFSSTAKLPLTMDKQSTVVFRNVGQLYFPQTRVECHYSLTASHQWSSSDWIGIFEVDCPTLAPSFYWKMHMWIKMFAFRHRWAGLLSNSITPTHGLLSLKSTLREPVSTAAQISRVRSEIRNVSAHKECKHQDSANRQGKVYL